MLSPSRLVVRSRSSVREAVRLCAGVGSLALTLCLSGQALADCPAIVRVPEDAPSINAAAAMICAGTTAEIQVAAGTWPASIASASGTEVTVRGAGVGVTTIVPTQAGGQFVVNACCGSYVRFVETSLVGGAGYQWNVSFDHCRIESSSATFFSQGRSITDTVFASCAGGSFGVIYEQAIGTIERCTFVECSRSILLWGDGAVGAAHVVRDCVFTDCTVSCIQINCSCCSFGANRARIERCSFTNTTGRAIYFSASQASGAQTPVLEVIDSQFSGNHNNLTVGGAAILIGNDTSNYTAANSNTTVTGCTFTSNSAVSGGAIYVKTFQPLTLTGCNFTNNHATNGGAVSHGVISSGATEQLSATDCVFSGNTASQWGGAISSAGQSGTFALNDCSFESNSAPYGGSVHVDRRSLSIDGCSFIGNVATAPTYEAGGAINASLVSGLISNSTFRGNHGSTRGGALSFNPWCTAGIEECIFEDNDAALGGAISIYGNCVQAIERCQFVGNQASAAGAAIWSAQGYPKDQSSITACRFSYDAGSTPAIAVIEASTPTELASSVFCGCGSEPFSGHIISLAPSCITETCADSDGDGMPDGCDVVTVPGDYATIQGAIDATVIGDFRIVTLGAGTFAGPISFAGKAVIVRGAGAGKTIIDGTASAAGSVVRFTGGEPVTAALEGVTVRGGQGGTPLPPNPAALVGGGVFGFNSAASIRNCVIEQNASGFGGGVYMFGCTGAIDGCVIRDNTAQADGGGLQIYGGATSVIDCSIANNYANSRGGGVHAVLGAHEFTRVSITSNASNNLVGGLSWVPDGNPAADLTLDDCTVTSNTAEKLYGGIGAVNDNGGPKLHLLGTQVCSNVPAPNISGPHTADATSEVCDCVADVIQDGVVNGVDLAALLTVWGTDGGTTPRADCSRDGIVNGVDLGTLLSAWGACAP